MNTRKIVSVLALCMTATTVAADHNALHAEACDVPDTVGGGDLGNSPGATLGWDVGAGQCNGSFVVTRLDANDKHAALELGLRVEQRSVGQVTRLPDNVYVVETGADPTNAARAWWNFHISAASGAPLETLKELTLRIDTIAGPNEPTASEVDLLAIRGAIDARNSAGSPGYADLLQSSQNPVFGWFNGGPFDFNAEGIWSFSLEAKPDKGKKQTVTMCVRTRNAAPLQDSGSPCDAGKSKKSKKSKK